MDCSVKLSSRARVSVSVSVSLWARIGANWRGHVGWDACMHACMGWNWMRVCMHGMHACMGCSRMGADGRRLGRVGAGTRGGMHAWDACMGCMHGMHAWDACMGCMHGMDA